MKKLAFTFAACVLGGQLLLVTASAAVSSPATISEDYFKVLRSGDITSLRKALDKGASPNATDPAGNTPLMLSAVYGNTETMRLLLARGAQVNAKNAAGATPLMRSASNFEKLRLLLEAGAEVNLHSALGNTALMLAARPANSHAAVELLLARGAHATDTNAFGADALMAAAAGGDALSVKLLIQHGANVNAQPGINHGDFILGGGRSALMWAAFHGDVQICKLLLDAGANVNGEGFTGTPLSQASWSGSKAAARLLIERGADVNYVDHGVGYTALHWAASSESQDAGLVKLLLDKGANPNVGGGENVDAFMDVLQTPLMLARKRGDSPILKALLKSGATNETPERLHATAPRSEIAGVRSAIGQAIPLLQSTSLQSKKAFVEHGSHQDCTSCHSQYIPLAAIASARKLQIPVDTQSERELIQIIGKGELKNLEPDWEALFHPDAVNTKGYALFGYAAEDLPANEFVDAAVHHLTVIQGPDGRWHNNLPRPPIQTSDVGATALAVNALQHYPFPGRKAEFAERVARARKWLWTARADNNEERVYQLLGLAWAGESAQKLAPLAKALIAEQQKDGGWSQLPNLKSDAYATGQALYALRVGAGLPATHSALAQGKQYLLSTQLEDGTWYVHRRAFPFQPTMTSGFPHGRDSWISTAATSWAVLSLSLFPETQVASRNP